MAGSLPLSFKLSVLGRFQLTGPVGPVSLPNRKLAGLLSYLACTAPKPQGREALMNLLWGSHFEAQARQNLRQALLRLRRVLGENVLVNSGEGVVLAPDLVSTDADRFATLVRIGDRQALAEAVDLYGGRLLPDLAISEEAWSSWLAGERQRLENLAIDAMAMLARHHLEDGNAQAALCVSQRAVGLDYLREDIHRLVMQAFASSGRRADALKHYEHVVAFLKRELGVEPDTLTKGLAVSLRKVQATVLFEHGLPPNPAPIASNLPHRAVVAVLPLLNIGGDPEQEYFADGIAEDILTELSKRRWLVVISRNSSFAFKSSAVSTRQIGEELGARYVLEGSVRKVGNRLRIVAQLIEAAADRHIWAEQYDRDIGDVFGIQDEIARQVVTAIDPAIQVSELDRTSRKPPESMDAYDHYLRGSYHQQLLRAEDARIALQHLKRATDIDPHFAAPHSLLALTYTYLASLGETEDVRRTLSAALDSAERAISLDPLDASAHGAASTALLYLLQYDQALQSGHRAVELNANHHPGHHALARALLFGGDAKNSLAEFETTTRLNPRDSGMWAILSEQALAHYCAKHYEAACESADRAILLRSDFVLALFVKAAALSRLDRLRDAAVLIARVPKLAYFQLAYFSPFRRESDWLHLATALEAAEIATFAGGTATCGALRCTALSLRRRRHDTTNSSTWRR